ncbi:DNA adenine methylase [Halobaculum sp. EA56]|uniref:DNA adenine methylase n=1 Tax=Halobaculum sp. EA56 TaxID=3421648 RepID=UPI003EB9B084
MVEPILKWAGGKRQILDAIKESLPPKEDVNRYHEPFVGGGALFFDTAPHPPGSTINDINTRLISFYKVVDERPKELIQKLRDFKPPNATPDPNREYSDEDWNGGEVDNYYYQQRELFNRRPRGEDFDKVEEAALLLYLNRTCYNGLYRENNSGEFNVPIGRHSSANWVMADRIRQASKVLSDIEMFNEDFNYIKKNAKSGDLVYFDPPYEPVSRSSSFVEYHHSAFGTEQQERLRDTALELARNDVWVVISNSPPMEELYDVFDEFIIHDIGAKRQINSVASDRDEVQEIIVTNVPENNRREKLKKLDSWMEPEA